MKYIFWIALSILLSAQSYAQYKKDTLTNKTIIELKTAGLGTDIIQSKIRTSPCLFDISTQALITLKKAGVPDDVVAAMISSTGSSSSPTATDTSVSIDPGIYYCKGMPCTLKELEASVYSQTKTGSGILTAMTYGIAKTNMKSTLSGTEANMRIQEKNPIFYFYFDQGTVNSFGRTDAQAFWFSSATSPNEFLLVKFTKTRKSREVVTGSWNEYAGLSSGIDDKNKIAFKYEKISRGVYKVHIEKPLTPGEYCFMYAGHSATTLGAAPIQKVYDFGITE